MMILWQRTTTEAPDVRQLDMLLLVCAVLLAGCARSEDYQRLSGATMGTYYSVVVRCPAQTDSIELQTLIDAELVEVNAVMSTYDPDSVLSIFNRSEPGGWQPVPAELVEVIGVAREISERSDGAFDVTVGPLVNAWGFGPSTAADIESSGARAPSAAELSDLLADVGYQQLRTQTQPFALQKTAPVYVDLSALAKGHGVDRVARLLLQTGCEHYLVDIGGEVRVAGVNPRGGRWSIGVEVPDPSSQGGIQRVLRLSNQSVATSGDYRNFRTVDGVRLSHTIDPRSGRPVTHSLASVTVVHPSAMWADGLATAISVLGPEAGMALARSMNLPILMVMRTDADLQYRLDADDGRSDGQRDGQIDGQRSGQSPEQSSDASFEERYTDAMKQYLVKS